ncbi:MAG: hypothetical protein OXF86_22940 [Caldilineaceae bacterium]|nr:hypothetical protein [Caldilineaceae bacterium]
MYDWTVLNQTVSETLASGTVGTPLFVRWTAAAANNTLELKPLLAEMSACAESWLSARPRRVYATGSADAGHLSLALEYENGQSALLSISLAHDHPSMNLIILGARGAIYQADSEVTAPAPNLAADKDEGMQHASLLSTPRMVAAIDKSLFSQQPVLLSAEGGQQ